MNETNSRPTLRDLPFPAKLVVTCFLISVGLGYCWALMQLHFKHASKGNLAPTPEDVVARFSGQRAPWEKDAQPQGNGNPPENRVDPKVEPKGDGRRVAQREVKDPEPKAAPKLVAGIKIKQLIADRCAICHSKDGAFAEKDDIPIDTYSNIKKLLDDPPQKGKIHKVINKDNDDGWGKDTMSAAFTRKSKLGKFEGEDLEWKDLIKKRPEAELRAERDTERKAMIAWIEAGAPEKAFNNDAFPLPPELRDKPLTKEYKTEAAEPTREEKAAAVVEAKKKKDPKQCQLSIESLTQSTHAHLLTFALLWAATGLVFAFTSYSLFVRSTIAPIVLIAQIADIACWWLARLPDVGPYFALAIIGTGAIVGLGLGLQIVLSLFNMYGGKGKFMIFLLLLVGGTGGGLVYTKYIAPMVAEEKQEAAK